MPHDLWDLSSETRDGTHAPCSGSTVLTPGPPGKYLKTLLTKESTVYKCFKVTDVYYKMDIIGGIWGWLTWVLCFAFSHKAIKKVSAEVLVSSNDSSGEGSISKHP